ncbi:MAG: HPr family phosphocarrier protein [Lachnospiraceae bacterium]|nr:HPr family phosphocarrier protein [Lachnospiraceae bacterium]
MEQFQYRIKEEAGMHARPAGLFVREASKYSSAIRISHREKSGDAKSILGVMGLGACKGDMITMNIEGADEKEAAWGLKQFLQNNL